MIDKATRKFILEHENEDPNQVIFKAATLNDVDGKLAAQQISSRQKAKKKLPSWYLHEEIIYPPKVPLEQSSSELTAKFKGDIFKGDSLADLTGGMGIDDWAFSYSFDEIFYCERQEDLANTSKYNFSVLGRKNIHVFPGDSLNWLEKRKETLSAIYLDPARRDAQNNKMVSIKDCEPNILEIKELLFQKTEKILIKLSPMIAIKQAVRELENVSKIWVISVGNECKEVLFLLNDTISEKTEIVCIDFRKDKTYSEYKFLLEDEEYKEVILAEDLGEYLYEPNASIMKAGAFKSIANDFLLKKLEMNSHLYTSDTFIENFPGRKFKIKGKSQVQKKNIKKLVPSLKANLTVRNFPQSVDQIRKKLKLKEGGNDYLFATTIMNNEKVLLLCDRINK